VPDQKPPRPVDGERATVVALLQYQRESIVRKVAGVDETAARQAFVGSGTSLLWLVKHLARAESLWVLRRFAGRDDQLPNDTIELEDTLLGAIDAYRQTWARTDAVIAAAASLDEACHDTGDESMVTLRWVLLHLLEETARHAGHADIIRELIDGQTGR
jgi:uncharacterized damage-inducible protein DinB